MYTVIAKFRHGLEQHSKIKFGVKQNVKWLGSIPYLHRFKRERHLMEISKNAFLTEHVWATASWKIKLENKLIGTGYNKVL